MTIALDDDVYDLAAARAAETNMSMSSLISSLIRQNAGRRRISAEEFERLAAIEVELRKQVGTFGSQHNVDRDTLHQRER